MISPGSRPCVGAGRPVGLDDLRRLLGVAQRPQAVAEARRHLGRLRAERRHVELRARPGARPQARVLELEPAGVHRHGLAVPQARDRLQARLQAAALLLVLRPVQPQRRLVDGLAGADAEEHAARVELLERHERLRDQTRVVVVHDRRHAGADRLLRDLPERAEVDPGLGRLAVGEPRREVVGGAEAVEAGAVGRLGLLEHLRRGELLRRGREPVLHRERSFRPGQTDRPTRRSAPCARDVPTRPSAGLSVSAQPLMQ